LKLQILYSLDLLVLMSRRQVAWVVCWQFTLCTVCLQ